ncbi:hypothetical protein B0H17DRAFT_929882, partial [Mycena rosella]
LPDNFHDFFTEITGSGPTAEILAHCRRELMHGVWAKIFDGDFMEAYEHGIVLECQDGISRRFFPRVFTYSADYPEKVLLACIRNLGKCPCPRCTITKDKIAGLGTKNDMNARIKLERTDNPTYQRHVDDARNWVYQEGNGVKSAGVERMLEPESLVPTKVRLDLKLCARRSTSHCRTLSLNAFQNSASIFTKCLFPTFCMRSSWASSSPSSPISYVY